MATTLQTSSTPDKTTKADHVNRRDRTRDSQEREREKDKLQKTERVRIPTE